MRDIREGFRCPVSDVSIAAGLKSGQLIVGAVFNRDYSV
jgi:hypothetical protein